MREWHCHAGGQQFGPVAEAIVVKWVRERRIGPEDYVWTEGMEQWAPVRTVPEFTQLVSEADGPGYSAPAVQSIQYSGGLGPGQGMAIAGMVLGIISVVLFFFLCAAQICGLIGLSLSSSALRRMREHQSRQGRGMAIAGLITSLVGLGLGLLMLLSILA